MPTGSGAALDVHAGGQAFGPWPSGPFSDAPAPSGKIMLSPDSPRTIRKAASPERETASELCGRYWDRTSDLFGVNEALSR